MEIKTFTQYKCYIFVNFSFFILIFQPKAYIIQT
nr:MAG TPA: hypothetical protein [Caudoviricetes sp.]